MSTYAERRALAERILAGLVTAGDPVRYLAAAFEAWEYMATHPTHTNPDEKPMRTTEMVRRGQVWVWMNGRGEPHWEMRGTGLVL